MDEDKALIISIMKKMKKMGLFEFENKELHWKVFHHLRERFVQLILTIDAALCGRCFEYSKFQSELSQSVGYNFPPEIIEKIGKDLSCEIKHFGNLRFNNTKTCLKNGKDWFREKNIYGKEYGPVYNIWSNITKCPKITELENIENHSIECDCYIVCDLAGTYRTEYSPIKSYSQILGKHLDSIIYEINRRRLNPTVMSPLCLCDSFAYKNGVEIDPKLYNLLINTRFFSNTDERHENCFIQTEDYFDRLAYIP